MILQNEHVDSAFEFSINCFIITIRPRNLLIVKDWQVTQEIDDPVIENIGKYWICHLPFFNETTFPFLIVSGMKSFNLVNVQTGRMDIIVGGSA